MVGSVQSVDIVDERMIRVLSRTVQNFIMLFRTA
jgi:hypothetical protein